MGLTDDQKLMKTWIWQIIAIYGDVTIQFAVIGDDMADAKETAVSSLKRLDKEAAEIIGIRRRGSVWELR